MKGVWLPADRAESRYHYVPVDAGPDGFTVTLAYDRRAGLRDGGSVGGVSNAVLDLGVFDPAGNFRGYSGGARDTFTITPRWATPGYLPGDIPAGRWSVLLGLHRVPAAGLPWQITVSPPGHRVGSRPALHQPPARRRLRVAATIGAQAKARRGVALRLVGQDMGRTLGVASGVGSGDRPDRRV